MDLSLVIKQRLKELGLEQKDLAAAAKVTDSYISQLLARKKAPPAPDRSEIYKRIDQILGFPNGRLSKLAEEQRREELRKKAVILPQPFFKEGRELLLRKCDPAMQKELRRIFQKESFGELERLVTQKLLDVTQSAAKKEMHKDEWLNGMAQLRTISLEQMRSFTLEFLHTDIFHISVTSCIYFLDPMIDSWNMDLRSFSMQVTLNSRFTAGGVKRFEFAEQEPYPSFGMEPGLEQFLKNTALSGNVTEEELEFLKTLKFKGKRPLALYYYRELQSLRDPLHFSPVALPGKSE